MAERPRVAIIVETSGNYGRRILDGIARYVRTHQRWSVFLEQRELRAPTPPWLLRTQWNGILCRSTDRHLARAILRRRIPTIDLNDMYGGLGLPRIWSDHRAIGRLGAKHLMNCKLHSFAFCGFTEETWSDLRREGFTQTVCATGHSCAAYESPWHGSHVPEWTADQEKIMRWIRSLPKPLGLMACNDVRGQPVLNACRSAEVAVPEEVAVVGVDNENVLCQLCDPPLSSVVPNPDRIGYEAAELLDQLMAAARTEGATRSTCANSRVGKGTIRGRSEFDVSPLPPSIAPEERLIPPMEVIARQSTDVLRIDDAEVAAAVQYIRENACRGVTMRDVMDHLAVSRSMLERRFRKCLGRSPQEEIREVQLKRVKELLAETDLALDVIARLAGYSHPEYMSVVFKRESGQTPGEYRQHVHRERKNLKEKMSVLNDFVGGDL
ncbi:MAG: XylR family transcriptional regulator [Thermoguttaceae bacterium]